MKTDSEKNNRTKGKDLFDQVVRLTGIPAKTIHKELQAILAKKNLDLNTLTLDQLRLVVASYLREIMSLRVTRNNEE